VEAVRALAPELVRPLSQLRAVILQASAHPDEVAVFLFENGRLRGPAAFSTVGMRIQNEQSGSSSLFPQPMAIEPTLEETGIRGQGAGISLDRPEEPIPEETLPAALSAGIAASDAMPAKLKRGLLEARMEAALAELADPSAAASATFRQGHLALLKRWYYRPEERRAGEIFFPGAEGHWPIKVMLRGVGRVAGSRFKMAGSSDLTNPK